MAASAESSDLSLVSWLPLVPRSETGSLALNKRGVRGAGITVAVFDTGVDARAPGLTLGPNGVVKVRALYDCTGAGDVDTNTRVTSSASDEGTSRLVSPFTSRSLVLPSSWANESSNQFQIGCVPSASLWPQGLKTRMRDENKKVMEEKQRALEQRLQIALASATPQERPELEAQLDVARELDKERESEKDEPTAQGDLLDVLTWKGKDNIWRCAVDVLGSGDLREAKVLRDYAVAFETTDLGGESACTLSVNIYDSGTRVELVTNAGSHGTHVAGIIAAYHENDEALNGVAPDAFIASYKIGDTRLGSMETGVSIPRAILQAIKDKVDIINISYGEQSFSATSGRIAELLNVAVGEGIIVIASAGNEGPGLSTTGTPGAYAPCIAVAAAVSAEMGRVAHSLRSELPNRVLNYSWSSRGPTLDGSLGPCIAAPGAAITSVPLWTQSKTQLMNGTSMSSPNAAGCVALILSALKAEKLDWSPSLIRRALENSAVHFSELNIGNNNPNKERVEPNSEALLSEGSGMLQADSALSRAAALSQGGDAGLRFEVKSSTGSRGLYLRDYHESLTVHEEAITIKPVFDSKYFTETGKSTWERRFTLKTSQPWLSAPQQLVLVNSERTVKVLVDFDKLERGKVHVAELRAYNATYPEFGVEFRFPVTVLRPLLWSEQPNWVYTSQELSFGPAVVHRTFLSPPAHVGLWAEIRIKAKGITPKRQFAISIHQQIAGLSTKRVHEDEYLFLQNEDEHVLRVNVHPFATLQIALAQTALQLGEAGTVTLSATLNGLLMSHQPLSALHAQPSTVGFTHQGSELIPATLRSLLRDEKTQLVGHYCVITKRISPLSSQTGPLSNTRDLWPPNLAVPRMLSTLNTYAFTVSEKDSTFVSSLLFRVQPLDGILYESPFEAQMVHVSDEHKRIIHVGDYQPEAISLPKKGRYVVRVLIRHREGAHAEALVKTLPLLLEKHLIKEKFPAISLFNSQSDALMGTGRISASAKPRTLRHGIVQPFVLAPPVESKLPGVWELGDVFLGYLSARPFDSDEGLLPHAVPKRGLQLPVGAVPVQYIVGTSASAPAPKDPKANIISKEAKEILGDSVGPENVAAAWQRGSDTELVSTLAKLGRNDELEVLFPKFLKEHVGYLPLLRVYIEWLSKRTSNPNPSWAHLKQLFEACTRLVYDSDPTELAQWFGVRRDSDSETVKESNRVHERRKEQLIFALHSHALGVCDALAALPNLPSEEERQKEKQTLGLELLRLIEVLKQWLKPEDPKFARLFIVEERSKGRPANALRHVRKFLANTPEKWLREVQLELVKELGWGYWADYLERRLLLLYPKSDSIIV